MRILDLMEKKCMWILTTSWSHPSNALPRDWLLTHIRYRYRNHWHWWKFTRADFSAPTFKGTSENVCFFLKRFDDNWSFEYYSGITITIHCYFHLRNRLWMWEPSGGQKYPCRGICLRGYSWCEQMFFQFSCRDLRVNLLRLRIWLLQ